EYRIVGAVKEYLYDNTDLYKNPFLYKNPYNAENKTLVGTYEYDGIKLYLQNAEAFENIVESLNLKYGYLKARTSEPVLDRIFARHFWWTGVAADPRFKELSGYCIQKATDLGYKGEKYMGGPAGHTLANILGWKPVRFMAYWQQRFKASWA
ncbi:hypothetical protein, partial [uncultured Mucilaginibacter sp.]|uniref:hypothetical protein n=1 Tax=uncultured Mucilaginibacter sp. TaxID=797541 RepID=UPI0025DA4237